ncbi:MAG TPA: alanine racemase, partial [Thermomicrobiales bacterium]|nr:alanine racemase [Thermomicrobiales bacterium]
MAQPPMNPDDPRGWGRPTWAEVDLDRVAGNVRAVRRIVGERCKIMAVVKANGYGHGAEMIAETALEAGADSLAVATVDEGIVLRTAGVTAPILILSPISPGEIPRSLRETLSLTVSNEATAKLIAAEAERLGSHPTPVHLKLDSGMRRFGGNLEEVLGAARFVKRAQSLRLAGLFTHFADADAEDRAFTDAQMSSLGECVSILADHGIAPDAVHASNSAALLRDRRYHLDMVRLGITLYGLPPSLDFRLPDEIQPVMSVVSTVAHTMVLKPGDTVSYGRTYRATAEERAALVPIGYA